MILPSESISCMTYTNCTTYEESLSLDCQSSKNSYTPLILSINCSLYYSKPDDSFYDSNYYCVVIIHLKLNKNFDL